LERGMAGLTTGTLHGKLGIRAGNTGLINLDDVPVPIENRIGEEGEGFLIAMSAIDQGRFTVEAGEVGLAKACLVEAVRFAPAPPADPCRLRARLPRGPAAPMRALAGPGLGPRDGMTRGGQWRQRVEAGLRAGAGTAPVAATTAGSWSTVLGPGLRMRPRAVT